jgi:hypothetical protein
LQKNIDSVEQSLLYSIGALIESVDYRGRAAPLAPRGSCLSYNAGLQGPLFHGGARSTEVFSKRTFFVRESSFPQPFSAVPLSNSLSNPFQCRVSESGFQNQSLR